MQKCCSECGKEFESTNNRPIRCPECQEKFRNEYQKKYQPIYWDDIPSSAHNPLYYQYWKFANTLTDDELQAIIPVKRNALKHEKNAGKKIELKTYMKICTTIYKSREKTRKNQRKVWQEIDNESTEVRGTIGC